MRIEFEEILHENFSQKEIKTIKQIIIICKKYPKNIEQHKLVWTYDQSLLGLGGYATPLNPTNNPFNKFGKERGIFRSLQYGRNDIFRGDRGRHIIVDTALHIETLVKLLVEANSNLSIIKNTKMLGKNIEYLYQKNIIKKSLYNKLIHIKEMINLSKHQYDENNDNTFSISDGIVFYFSSRKIGNQILKILGHPTYNQKYKIQY